jgi:hypothetical protein
MAAKSAKAMSPVEAVQSVFEALEPLDAENRQRVIASALSLLGMTPSTTTAAATASAASARPAADLRDQTAESRPAARAKSPVELIKEKNPATNAQLIALFAYHREKVEGESRFSKGDLKSYFSKAKEPAPANYDRDFSVAVREGWIHEDGAESYLTSKGIEAVEAGFGGKRRANSARGAKKTGRKKAARSNTKKK